MRAQCLSRHLTVAWALYAGAFALAGAAPAAAQTSAAAAPAPAQQAPSPQAPTLCGQPVPPPANLPPPESGPVVYFLGPCFPKQGGVSVIEPETYLYYIKLRPSLSSQNLWVPYDTEAEKTIHEDFVRLWATNFLDDLSIEATDYIFANGVIGKLVAYNMEERQRVKIVTYPGTKKVEQGKIDEKLREKGLAIRLDSFIDPGLLRRVAGVARDLMAEKGYQDAQVVPEITPVPGGPKLVNVAFRITEGPKVKIGEVEFVGNKAFGDGRLNRRLKNNKGPGLLSIFGGGGTYQEAKFEEDAERVVEYYREHGYIEVKVGQPDLKHLRDASDGKTRYMQLRIPVTEGQRYKVGEFGFDGNKIVKTEGLRPLFKLNAGDFYNEKKIRDGLEKTREIYGAGGYFEFTGFPDLKPQTPAADATPAGGSPPRTPLVDVTMRMQEGKQYFVNRLTFVGNTTTRDNVIRRELRLVENGVFDTEALKNSVKRLNQLGYFKPLEDQKNIVVDKTAGADNKVDVTLKLEEQNRNQLTFGAGMSQFDGVFGQLSFQTANFMGRGESLTVSVQAGSRAHDYQVAFTEPFLFDRPITGGIDLFKRDIRYISQYTQASTGGNLTAGFRVASFTQMYLNYSLEQVKVKELNELFFDSSCLASTTGCREVDLSNLSSDQLTLLQRNPFLYDSLLIGRGGRRTISKITPSVALNTVDNPIFPATGRRYTASMALAGIGGDTSFYKPSLEGVWYFRQSRKTSVGMRGQVEYIRPLGSTVALPIFEKLFQGGGYSVRGYDIRSIGPRDEQTGLVVGGNKSLLLNGEYLISIAGPVRLVLFYDAGQVQDRGQRFTKDGFITSTGAEVRFFMPVLNVPFRLIFAYNAQRDGVLDNNLQPERKFRFRFDVGSTF